MSKAERYLNMASLVAVLLAGVAVALILLIFWMPTRIFPPRAPA